MQPVPCVVTLPHPEHTVEVSSFPQVSQIGVKDKVISPQPLQSGTSATIVQLQVTPLARISQLDRAQVVHTAPRVLIRHPLRRHVEHVESL